MDTTAVSPSLDRLLEQQAGCVRGLVSCREHAAPDNVKNFGSALGLSCERVRGRSPARPAEMADAVGRWASSVADRSRQDSAAIIATFGETAGGAKWPAPFAGSAADGRALQGKRTLQEQALEGLRGSQPPEIADSIAAFSEGLLPCSAMCTTWHQRMPTPRRLPLIVHQRSDKWMVYGRYDLTGLGGHTMGGLRPRVETYRMERYLGGLQEEATTPHPESVASDRPRACAPGRAAACLPPLIGAAVIDDAGDCRY